MQHTDVAAQILEFGGATPMRSLHGKPFFQPLPFTRLHARDHVTIAWGTALTVVDDRWWMNAKVDGRGIFLYDLVAANPFETNVAEAHGDVIVRAVRPGA